MAATLRDSQGPLDLTGATVQFVMTDCAGNEILKAPATVIGAEIGRVQYDWQAGDTDATGSFRAEFDVTFSDGSNLTVPNDRDIEVLIMSDLG